MTFEVWNNFLEEGVVRFKDLRAVLGKRVHLIESVDVVALVHDRIVRTRIGLTEKRSGRGVHRLFACPGCGEPRGVLRWDAELAGFRCATCRPHRTNRQRFRSTDWWRVHGGAQLDELVRWALRPPTEEVTRPMSQLTRSILERDQQRVAAHEAVAHGYIDREATR